MRRITCLIGILLLILWWCLNVYHVVSLFSCLVLSHTHICFVEPCLKSHPFIGIFFYCSTTSCSKWYASFSFMLTCTCFVFWTTMGELWFHFCALCIQNAIFLNHAQILGSSSIFFIKKIVIFSNHNIFVRLVCRIFLIACFSFGEDLRFCIPSY